MFATEIISYIAVLVFADGANKNKGAHPLEFTPMDTLPFAMP